MSNAYLNQVNSVTTIDILVQIIKMASASLGLNALSDTILALSLVFFLRRNRTGVKR